MKAIQVFVHVDDLNVTHFAIVVDGKVKTRLQHTTAATAEMKRKMRNDIIMALKSTGSRTTIQIILKDGKTSADGVLDAFDGSEYRDRISPVFLQMTQLYAFHCIVSVGEVTISYLHGLDMALDCSSIAEWSNDPGAILFNMYERYKKIIDRFS